MDTVRLIGNRSPATAKESDLSRVRQAATAVAGLMLRPASRADYQRLSAICDRKQARCVVQWIVGCRPSSRFVLVDDLSCVFFVDGRN
jgi:hypothetical protein